LKSLKPSLNINDANSDFVIRGNAFSGLISGVYGDQANVYGDTFISTMRSAALLLKGADYGIPQNLATAAASSGIQISGANGTVISVGQLTFIYPSTNFLYTNTTGGTITGGVLTLSIEAEAAGQAGNVAAPDTLTVVSPPNGVNGTAAVVTSIADGTDDESFDSYRARLLSREQNPPAGGNVTDYPAFAFAADPSVRSANVFRFALGLGTVAVYITTGTTDIDTAVTQGLSIVRIPSTQLLATVQAYYNAHVPLTDCPSVYGPTEQDIPVTVYVDLAQGLSLTSVPSDAVNNPLGLNCQQLIQREVGRALYKYPVGGRTIPGQSSGVVAASDIEYNLDIYLSAVTDTVSGLLIGKLPILADRYVAPLSGTSYELQVTQNVLPAPGTVTVNLGVP
jgi:uncharacterized phage protein gp47/JayE